MKTFFCKLIPPRPTFDRDLSGDEAKLMHAHAAYWRGWMGKGKVVAFGPIADPAGAFGVAILEVAGEREVQQLTSDDPVIRSGRGFRWELHPMPLGAVHPPYSAVNGQ
ncbi:MAG TPA: YciI family protein [Rhodanobacteraceae bacterium]